MTTWTHVAYMDESHNACVYWMCAVVVHVDSVRDTQAALDEVVAAAAPTIGIAADAELHGADMWQAKGDYKGVEPWLRAQMLTDSLRSSN